MKPTLIVPFLLMSAGVHAGMVRIGPFAGTRLTDAEDFNFLWNPARSHDRIGVESGPNAIYGFDDDHMEGARFLRNPVNDPGARGFAYSGKSLSIDTEDSRIELRLQADLNPGGLRTLRFGGWFMLNSQPLTFHFWGLSGAYFGSDTISGYTDNLQYQWFGWEAQGVAFQYALIQHEGPRNQYSNFHVDDFTWEPVPEPASLLALAGGVAALARRRKAR